MTQSGKLDLGDTAVEEFSFPEPIKGYPELNWRGKRPFRYTRYFPATLSEVFGDDIEGWRNKIYWGDNLQVLSHLLKKHRGSVDLIYIDPPFDSKVDYRRPIKLRGKSISSDYTAFEEKQYGDMWNNDEYLQFMFERLTILKEILNENGVIALHCDWHRSHQLRCLLDIVFGPDKFINEIVWHYYNKMQGNINRVASNHDTIFIYGKSKNFFFNKIREKRDEPVRQIKRVWDKESQSIVNAKDENGNIIYITATHKTIDDVWRMPMLQPADRTEATGYPTQKPEALVERIIEAYSRPGAIVMDSFMGSGTAPVVAFKLGRRFIGIDINLASVQESTKRLLSEWIEHSKRTFYTPNIKNGLDRSPEATEEDADLFETAELDKGEGVYSGFEVYNVNHYDVFRNPLEARDLLIEALEIQKLPAGSLFDGEKDGRMVKIMPVNRIATRADLNDLIANFDYKDFERRKAENPTKPVEKITLVCMGHEPDLAAQLQKEVGEFKLDVQVVDILRDRDDLQFKRDSEAKITVKDGQLVIEAFYPMNLLSKLSLQQENVTDWRELVESVMIDWNYDGAILNPTTVDIPERNELVKGTYRVPDDAGTIKVKITDLLSESLEMEVQS